MVSMDPWQWRSEVSEFHGDVEFGPSFPIAPGMMSVPFMTGFSMPSVDGSGRMDRYTTSFP